MSLASRLLVLLVFIITALYCHPAVMYSIRMYTLKQTRYMRHSDDLHNSSQTPCFIRSSLHQSSSVISTCNWLFFINDL